MIRKLQNQGLIDTWFFIRYLDPDFHIRLRLKVKENAEAEVLAFVKKSLRSGYAMGLIHEVQMSPYERELERYGVVVIEEIENLFQYSSELSLQLLKLPQAGDNYFLLQLALVLMVETLSCLSLEEKNELIHFQYQAFFEDFRGDKKLQVAMDNIIEDLD